LGSGFCIDGLENRDLPCKRQKLRGLLKFDRIGNLKTVLGCASTVFWGYITRNEPFGRYKAWRLVAANEKQMIHAQLKEVLATCAAGAWGGALEELSGVSELGRVSFSSKVVAFVDPENAGI